MLIESEVDFGLLYPTTDQQRERNGLLLHHNSEVLLTLSNFSFHTSTTGIHKIFGELAKTFPSINLNHCEENVKSTTVSPFEERKL